MSFNLMIVHAAILLSPSKTTFSLMKSFHANNLNIENVIQSDDQ